MNNFEQNANFYDDLAQIAHKLALIAENRLPVTPLERDLTLQLLRDAYLNVLQCTHTAAEPAPEPEPVRIAEPAPVPQPEPVKVVAPESEPEPARVVKIEPRPEPIKMVQPEPEPEPVRMVEPEPVPQPTPQPEPVKVVEPEPQPVPDILSYLEVEEPVAEPEPVVEPEPIREPEPKPEPIHPTPAPAPVIKDEPTPAPQPQVHPQPAPAELFPEEPAPAPLPKRSLNDLLGKEDNSLASQFQHSHIDDLSKAISLNDKFLYIKELFKGKGEDFSKAIQKLNVCPNIDEAFQTIDMLKKYYAWDTDSSAYLALCDLVRRKFV